MKLLLAVITLVLSVGACKKPPVARTYLTTPIDTTATPPQDTMTQPVNDTSNTLKLSYLALGDSYTIGQSVEIADRFPIQTAKLLKQLAVNVDTTEIIAQTGWTTGNLLSQLAAAPPAKSKYDFVSLLIGVNNQYQGRSQEEYRSEFVLLLTKSIALAGNKPGRVFVLSIPDYSVTPFASSSNKELIAREIDAFNAINLQEAQVAGVQYLEITSSTRQAATDASLIATDGLHPSGKEYNKWAQNLAPLIKAAL